MEKMSPPPNYFGAPYPNPSMQNSSMPFNQNQYNAPQFNTQEPRPNNEQNSIPSTGYNTYDDITESIKNAEVLFETLKNTVASSINKRVKVYCSFTDSSKWHDVIFEGVLVGAADDYLLFRTSEKQIDLISRIYVNYISFFEN